MSQHFHALTIAAVTPDTDVAVRVRLAITDDLRDAFAYRPGQHLTLRRTIAGTEHRRTYSICSGPGERDLTITVKRIPGGLVSGHINDTFKAGDVVDVMAPSGRFVLPQSDGRPRTCLAVAAGSGITPVIAMIRHLLDGEPSSRFVLLFGNRDVGSILFRENLEDLKDRHLDRLVVAHVLSRGDGEAEVPLLAGRIDAAKIAALVPRLVDPAEIAHAFLCGPGSMAKEAMNALQGLGVPRERIHFEFFVRGAEPVVQRPEPAASTPAATAEAVTEAVLVIDGVRHRIEMRPGEAIIDAAIRSGVNAPYSCKGGMCCTCRAKLLEGEADMQQNYSLEPWEIERGYILTCQSVPRTARVVVDYDDV